MDLHIRLIALQTTEELERKATKSIRKGYRKEGSFYRGTQETHDLLFRSMDEEMKATSKSG